MLFEFVFVSLVYFTPIHYVLELHLNPVINQLAITIPPTLKLTALFHQLLCVQQFHLFLCIPCIRSTHYQCVQKLQNAILNPGNGLPIRIPFST